jgi:hypothetical protein
VVRNYLIPASFLGLLSPADLALGYNNCNALRRPGAGSKGALRVRPVYHWAVHRIHAHVAWRVLGLGLERGIEQTCGNTGRNIRADVDQRKLAQLLSPHGAVWPVTEPSPDASTP